MLMEDEKQLQIAQVYEERDLIQLVEVFGRHQVEKLKMKMREGYTGWDSPNSVEAMEVSLQQHVDKGFVDPENLVDIANLAMFLWNLRGRE
jgi:hypothetical protein